MTTEEKKTRLEQFCKNRKCQGEGCRGCALEGLDNCNFDDFSDYCTECMYYRVFENEKEEINHPDRYAGGKYECIDVMQDVFGKEDVLSFCKLNAFKYIWREKQKNGVQDMKKAAWYINKYIELSEEPGESEE